MLSIWKYFLRTYYVVSIGLDSWDAKMNTDGYWLERACSLKWRTHTYTQTFSGNKRTYSRQTPDLNTTILYKTALPTLREKSCYVSLSDVTNRTI